MTSGGHLKRFSSNNWKIKTRVTKILEKQSEKSHWFTKFVINVQCWFYTWRHSSKSQDLWWWKILSQFIGKLWSRLFNQWGVCSPEIYYPSGCDKHRCEKVFYIESSKPQIVLLLKVKASSNGETWLLAKRKIYKKEKNLNFTLPKVDFSSAIHCPPENEKFYKQWKTLQRKKAKKYLLFISKT